MSTTNILFEDWEAKQMQDPEFRAAVKELGDLPPMMAQEEIRQELLVFEEKYNMKSDDFYSRRQRGEDLRIMDGLRWAMLYELWLESG